MRVRQHQVLHGELDVDHAARVVLQVEQRACGFGMAGGHLAAHVGDVGRERARVARQAQDRFAFRLERRAERGVAGHEARAGERLVLPRPRVFALVFAEGREARHEQAGRAIGPQPQVGVVELAGRRCCS